MTRRTIELGKIAYNGTGRINRVSIEVELNNGRLSICGAIWNGRGTDWISGGQNLDEIAKLFPTNAKVKRIVAIWRDWHLNDMRAGSPRQMVVANEHIRQHEKAGTRYSYESICEALSAANLLVDNEFIHNGKPYEYGSAWLRTDLPAEVVEEIEGWFAD